MHRVLLSTAVVLLACSAWATSEPQPEPKPALALEAEVTAPGRLGQVMKVRLVNTGKTPLTVLTAKLQLKAEAGEQQLTVALGMTEQRKHNDRLVVPTADSLGLVKLLPGEVAVVTVPNAPLQKKVEALGGKGKVTVTYEVSEFWGKRFGVWHGKITAEATFPK